MSHDQIQCVNLHITRVGSVSGLEDLNQVVNLDFALQIVLAKGLQSGIGKHVKRAGGKEVQRILGRHFHISVVNVPRNDV